MSVIRQLSAALSRAQSARPSLRLSQILSNAASMANGPGGDDDIFYMTDEQLARAVSRYAEYLEDGE